MRLIRYQICQGSALTITPADCSGFQAYFLLFLFLFALIQSLSISLNLHCHLASSVPKKRCRTIMVGWKKCSSTYICVSSFRWAKFCVPFRSSKQGRSGWRGWCWAWFGCLWSTGCWCKKGCKIYAFPPSNKCSTRAKVNGCQAKIWHPDNVHRPHTFLPTCWVKTMLYLQSFLVFVFSWSNDAERPIFA